jgi:PAS domain-containing protein
MAAEGTVDNGAVDTTKPDTTTTAVEKPGAVDQRKPDTTKQDTKPEQKTGDDRRDQGVLADLIKERKARQAAEALAAKHQTELEAERRRVAALAGVTPRSKDEIDAEEVRQQFSRLFPGLAKLNDQQVMEKLERILSNADTHEDTTTRYWNDRAAQMTGAVVEAVSKELGGDLSERQVRRIRAAYANAAESDPEFLRRHEEGDKTLIAEFAKEWIEDWFEPARRKVTSTEVDRLRRVPRGNDRTVIAGKPKQIDFKNPKAVEDAMIESYRAHGGTFGE